MVIRAGICHNNVICKILQIIYKLWFGLGQICTAHIQLSVWLVEFLLIPILNFDFVEKDKTYKLFIKVNGEIMSMTLPNHFTIKDIKDIYDYTGSEKKNY